MGNTSFYKIYVFTYCMGSLGIDFSFKGALTMSAKETKEFYFSVKL